MTLLKRLRLLTKYTGVTTFVLIALIYGVFFGGFTSLGSVSDNESVVLSFVLSALASGGAYFVIFTFAMAAVYILANTKLFMSFNMPLKVIRQMWVDLTLSITAVNGSILGLILFMIGKESSHTIRVLDMDLTQMNLSNMVLLIGLILITSLFLTQLVSFICNIGNRFGIFFAFGTLALVGTGVVFSFSQIIHMIKWGEQIGLFVFVTATITILLFGINFKMIQKTEVTR